MKLFSNSFPPGGPIPARYAFGRMAPVTHVALSENLNPHLAWSGAPEGTRSFVLVCYDPDVPSRGDDVNREDRTVPIGLPRVDFFHWVLLDIPASATEIPEGSQGQGVTPRGKPGPAAPGGLRHGTNDYTAWFAADADMQGAYFGYDGPCPPWNDERLHHYVFTLYALDVGALDLDGAFDGRAVREAMAGHVLASASLTGTYTLNPDLAG